MRMYAFHGGGENLVRAVIDPFDSDPAAPIYFPYFSFLLEHEGSRVLFDTGAHPDFITDPTTRLGPAAESYEIVMGKGDDIVSCLALVDVKPSDIEHVVQSHLHYDHAGGLEFFPESTIYVGDKERAFAYDPPVYQREFVRKDFDYPLNWKELGGEHDIFGDGSVVIFPTPGHTPGHQSLLVKLDSGAYILAGDAAYDREKMENRRLSAVTWNPDAVVASWERIEEKARTHNAQLIFTHDIHYQETMRVAPSEWYE
jgi:N-acyl homoserine lactone hydrolase